MSHLKTELGIRALRAQLGAQFRRHGPVIDTLRLSVMELEQQTDDRDVDYLHERLTGVLHKWRIHLLIQANPWLILQRAFYRRPSQLVGPGLLGNIIVTDDGRAARIAEVVTCEEAPRDADLPSDAIGRLVVSGESPEPKVCVLCGHPSDTSAVALARIEPLEGLALMTAHTPSEHPTSFIGAAIVHALGLGHRPHAIDLTHRRSAVQIASILQPVPLVVGRPRRIRRNSRAREWRWSIATASR
jgi:3-methyladenine DNA glycosylase Mpg